MKDSLIEICLNVWLFNSHSVQSFNTQQQKKEISSLIHKLSICKNGFLVKLNLKNHLILIAKCRINGILSRKMEI